MTLRFKSAFSIEFIIIRYVFWDSNDDITKDISAFESEVVAETGFYSGMTYNTIPIDILIAFSDQTVIYVDPEGKERVVYGKANEELGTVIVFEECFAIFPFYCAHYTANILQHELSHLYECEHHRVPEGHPNYDCVMNTYPFYIDWPEGRWVPYTFMTINWCDDCRNLINQNKGKWGRQAIVGGGDPLIFPIPYAREMEELDET